jgi:PIN domain nuclease of toxin-antitoxin system
MTLASHLDFRWVYHGELERFSKKGQDLIENESLFISPMVLLELNYLLEAGKISAKPSVVFSELAETLDLKLFKHPFVDIIDIASTLSWTRDVFDRIILANAILQKAPLLTKDQLILEHYKLAIW